MIKHSKDFQNILTSLDSITADLNIENGLHSLYNPINYKENPTSYCSMKITDNPYYDM